MNIAGLYSGFSWLAVGRTLGVGARFGTYEILTAFYKGYSLQFSCNQYVVILCTLLNKHVIEWYISQLPKLSVVASVCDRWSRG